MSPPARHITRRRMLRLAAVSLPALALAIPVWRLLHPAATLRDAESAVLTGQVAEARRICEAITARDPANGPAWFRLGQLCEELQDFDAAVTAFERAMETGADRTAAGKRLGFCLLQSGLYGRAETTFRELLQVTPDDEAIQTELQWLLFNQLRERELEIFLEEQLKREPASFRLLQHLLLSSQRRPNPREAIRLLEAIQKAKPGQADIELALGHCYWKLGRLAEADRFLHEAGRRRPDHVETTLLLAEFQLEQGRQTDTGRLLTGLKASWSVDDRWWWLTAQWQQRSGRAAEALQSLLKAVELRPGEIRYHHTLATWLQAAGRNEEARHHHELARVLSQADRDLYVIVSRDRIAPDQAEVCRAISECCRRLQRKAQAEGWRMLLEAAGRR